MKYDYRRGIVSTSISLLLTLYGWFVSVEPAYASTLFQQPTPTVEASIIEPEQPLTPEIPADRSNSPTTSTPLMVGSNGLPGADGIAALLEKWQIGDGTLSVNLCSTMRMLTPLLGLRAEGSCFHMIGFAKAQAGDNAAALKAYKKSLAIWRELELEVEEGIALGNIGAIYENQGEYEQALTNYTLAYEIAVRVNDTFGQAINLNNMGSVSTHLSQYQEALTYLEDALPIAQAIGLQGMEGTILNNIGIVYDHRGEFEKALDYYMQALPIHRAVSNQLMEGKTLNNIGEIYRTRGRYDLAFEYYGQALLVVDKLGNQASIGPILNNIGTLRNRIGDYEQALRVLQKAQAIQQSIGDRAGEAITLNNLAGVYYNLGDIEKTLDALEQASTIQQDIDNRREAGIALDNIATVYQHLRRTEAALKNFETALEIRRSIGDRAGEGITLNNIALTYLALGDTNQALVYGHDALELQRAIGDRPWEAITLHGLGFINHQLGDYRQALQFYQDALAVHRAVGAREEQIPTLIQIGLLHEQQQRVAQALTHYREAIEMIETIQRALKVDDFGAGFSDSYAKAYAIIIELLWKEGHFAEAFAYAERARARVFLNQIGNQHVDFRQGNNQVLIEQEQTKRQQIASLQLELEQERAKPFEERNQILLDNLGDELALARDQHRDLINQLKLVNAEYASLLSVDTLPLADIQSQVLDTKTTLIEYFITDAHIFAWVVDHSTVQAIRLDLSPQELTAQIKHLNGLVQLKEFDDQTAARLYDSLVKPLRSSIAHENLLIVPHDILHFLPFAALLNDADGHYLVEDYTVTYAPSASSLRFLHEKRNINNNRILVMGNPDGTLPLAEVEANAIAQIHEAVALLQGEATEQELYIQAKQADIIHLAAHGVYDPLNPLYTRIELNPNQEHDGNVEVHEIFGLDLAKANLVVLSACETSLGEQSRGDEIVGLPRAFLYAGAPAVVTTLWSINDEASAILMESFYRQRAMGMTTAQALQAAQMHIRALNDWNSPYYWAAFSLTGDYR